MAIQANEGRAQLHAHVPTYVRSELVEIARANDRSISAEIRRALTEYVRRERPGSARDDTRHGDDEAA